MSEYRAGAGSRSRKVGSAHRLRKNETHVSTTDPDAKLFRKGQGREARLCFMGHALMENRHGLVVQAHLTEASAPAIRVVHLLHNAELLAGEQFSTPYEAQVLIERWRRNYNAVRPHSSLGYRAPAPETILPTASDLPYAALRPAQMLANSGRGLT